MRGIRDCAGEFPLRQCPLGENSRIRPFSVRPKVFRVVNLLPHRSALSHSAVKAVDALFGFHSHGPSAQLKPVLESKFL